jgi:hypothetical protein
VTLVEHALRGAVLEAGSRNRLRVGLPWYRSMPFSSIVGIDVEVDGAAVQDVRLDVGGVALPVGRLQEVSGRIWFLQDRHALEWSGPAASGTRAEVAVRLRLHLPNLIGPDGGSIQVLQEVRAGVPVEPAS